MKTFKTHQILVLNLQLKNSLKINEKHRNIHFSLKSVEYASIHC